MTQSNLSKFVGFAVKSKQILVGYDNILSAHKKPCLVLICKTADSHNVEKMVQECLQQGVAVAKTLVETLDEVSHLQHVKFLAITNASLAHAIEQANQEVQIIKRGNN